MTGMNGSKFMSLVLIPAFLLAQLLCVCASTATAIPHKTVSTNTQHECCDDEKTSHDEHSPVRQQDEHESKCPHCTSVNQIQTDLASGESAKFVAFGPVLLPLLPVLLPDCRDDSEVRYQSFVVWLTDPSPQSDLLRMKCALQI